MEKLDIYDINGNKTGKTINRGDKNFGDDEYIKLAVVYLKSNNKYLIQKCSQQKGGEYAITGGHTTSGNTSFEQAIIETKEELNLNINPNKLQFLGSHIIGKHAMFDVFLYEDNSLTNFNFTLQPEEVEAVYWLTKSEFEDLIKQNLVRKSSIEHYNKFIKDNK